MASRALPTGTVTFLFTDIENSTSLWDQFPEQMKPALSIHDAILRSAIETHNGVVVKTTGDGVHAAFETVQEAVAAAQAIQMALLSETAEPAIRVRAGLHTGDAQLREGDYYGSAVNRAARLMSIGHGGQILLSSITAGLLDGRLPPDTSLRDLGDHRLRGLNRPERVFQLAAPGLPDAFPPLRTDATLPGNLPELLTSFIGREHELAELTDHLHQARMLTITGPGGTGKTRLSLQVAREVLPTYRHGVWFVELAPVTDPDLVPQTVASLWDLSAGPGGVLQQQLADYLRAKQMMLILDNCEHLVAACAELAAELLPVAPGLTILASSREGLGVPGETTYNLPALGVPPRSVTSAEGVASYDAVQLFVERAQAARKGFMLTDRNAVAVGQIVRRLDGIPLAIELAASRTKLMPPEQLASHLDERFRLLTGGSRTALPRQQTLRALIDWSYDLLDPKEQWFLRQLGVFVGGWSLEAAEAMLAGADLTDLSSLDVFDLLASLVNKSLVIMEDEEGEARFDFLQTIRQYARDKLFEAGETTAARDRHLDYFSGRIFSLAPVTSTMSDIDYTIIGMVDERIPTWIDGLRPELENVRAAIEWALESDPECALAMAVDMVAWLNLVTIDEASTDLLVAALAAVDALPEGDEAATIRRNWLRVTAMMLRAYMFARAGQNKIGFENQLEATAYARSLGKPFETALGTSLSMSITAGMFSGAPNLLEIASEALEINSKFDFPLGTVGPLTVIGFAHLQAGDVAAANATFDEAQNVVKSDPHSFVRAMSALPLSRLAESLGRIDEAREILESMERFSGSALGSVAGQIARSDLAHLERRQGNDAAAEAIYREVIVEWLDMGHRPAVANQLESFAFIAAHRERYNRAATLFGAAEALRAAVDVAMQPHEQVEYDRETAVLRAAMEPAELAEAWQAGRGMDIETAVQFARGSDQLQDEL